jgi:3-oxoacyl-(acyl-carrier-protein) synthase
VVVSKIFIHGFGAVSPAGWGVAALRDALKKDLPLPTQTLARPGWEKPLLIRAVPPPVSRPAFFAHPRLRRANLIAQFTVAAALEALGDDVEKIRAGELRLGIVVCVMAGSVNYSRRFYEEVLREPATASPLIFPETVFNAPASHLAAFLGSNAASCTLVGDDGTFLQGLALAAQWLADDKMDACVVVGAEETDWIVADAMKLFQRDAVHSAGAGAVLLKKNSGGALAELSAVTDSFPFTQTQGRADAAQKMRAQFPPGARSELLCASAQKIFGNDAAENLAWKNWAGARLFPKAVLGEAFAASAAWQCVAACGAIRQREFSAANVSVVGANQQAVGARFLACAAAV